jgi:outer membrane protein assembly factor BamB
LQTAGDDSGMPATRAVLLVAVIWFVTVKASAADWPQFLGPKRDGTTPDEVADRFPQAGPPAVWSKKVGHGFSGPVVAGGAVLLFHRVGDVAVLDAYDAAHGKLKWSAKYPTNYRDDFGFDEGPRATPAVAGGLVYTLGAEGALACWRAEDGGKVWSVDTKAAFNADKGFFGVACSPLVEGDLVVINVGGRDGAGIVAFDRNDGKVRWKATNDEAGYASPVAATVNEKRYVLSFTREGLVGLDPAGGAVRFTFHWRSRSHASVNAATPLVVGDTIFLSASYGTGAVLLRLQDERPQEVWSGDDSLSNHYATSVHHKGYLYGFDGRQEQTPRLRCVEWATGQVKWTEEDFGAGTLIVAGDRLLILTEKGELVVAPATHDGFKPTARANVLQSEARAHAALANGMFFARDKDTLVCVDLHGRKP